MNKKINQKGYILPFTLVIISILMITTSGFFQRGQNATDVSVLVRDYDLALILSESALNRVAGKFYSADTSTNTDFCTSAKKIGDMNCDSTLDNMQAMPSSTTPIDPTLSYAFIVVKGTGEINSRSPSLLASLSAGEARNTSVALTSPLILNTVTAFKMTNLFINANEHPILLKSDNNGLTFSNNTWATETAPAKAAVFFEVVKSANTLQPTWYDVWACSFAKVNDSKAYSMKYVGSYAP